MRSALAFLLISLFAAAPTLAQDVRYISDKQFVPLRSGAGTDYRISHRGLPSGTRLTVARSSDDGLWAEITTDAGTNGWIRTQYMMNEVPAAKRLDAAIKKAEQAAGKSTELAAELETFKAERAQLLGQVTDSDSQLGSVSEQLNQLKQVSGKAVQLDEDNRRLIIESENLRSEVETLEAENLRLKDKLSSEDFLNGALAVLLGVIITLVVPRLWPKRRKSSSWA